MDRPSELLPSLPWVIFWGASDPGKVRDLNEDRYLLQPWPDGTALLAVVADGLGGSQSGEVAAQIAIDTFAALLHQTLPAAWLDRYAALKQCFHAADTAIREQANQRFDQLGMGATVVAAIFTPTDYLYLYAGDCRFYHWRGGEPVRISADHSIIRLLLEGGLITPEQVATHPMRAIVNSCLGGKGGTGEFAIDPPWAEENPPIYPLQPQDTFLLCSDGLHSSVSAAHLQHLLQLGSPSPQALTAALIDAALAAGGEDNITVLAIHPRLLQAASLSNSVTS